MPQKLTQIILLTLFICAGNSCFAQTVQYWLTDPLHQILFKRQQDIDFFKDDGKADIFINSNETFQTIDGFGFALTGGSAQLLLRMHKQNRKALLKELFGTKKNQIATSYLRLSIGASDLNEKIFSYNDLPWGETDIMMEKFDLGQDKLDVIPVLKQILAINPRIKIMASPWSPPVWMKTNNHTKGGSLKPIYYDAYALYFVKYIQEMQKLGINIDAITVQNEPLNPDNNPSLLMLAKEQAAFIKQSLGPAFKRAGLKTKIIIYDHNTDRPDYPISILDDPEAKQYINGSAFHLYAGSIDVLSEVHNAHPDKNLYFTEQWVRAPGNITTDIPFHISHLIIGATRNWAKTVLEWNLASNSKNEPHTDNGGCRLCLGAVTVDSNKVKRNPAYYIIAQAAMFVRPGAVRVASNHVKGLPNVAFKNLNGKMVLIVLNETKNQRHFSVKHSNRVFNLSLNSNAAATLIW